jgi:hypothetical protein
MQNLRRHTDQQLEAQRFTASQARRECEQLDALSVYLVVKAKIEAGLVDEAREIVKKYRNGEL